MMLSYYPTWLEDIVKDKGTKPKGKERIDHDRSD